MTEAGGQHLPAPAPHAAALPSLGALAAGGPCRGATHRSRAAAAAAPQSPRPALIHPPRNARRAPLAAAGGAGLRRGGRWDA